MNDGQKLEHVTPAAWIQNVNRETLYNIWLNEFDVAPGCNTFLNQIKLQWFVIYLLSILLMTPYIN